MKRIVPYSDEEIAQRVALRAACNRQAAEVSKAARKRAEEAHYEATRAKTSATFSDLVVRDAAKMTFRWTRPDAEAQAQIDALKAAAEEALPAALKSERWEVGDCGCVVHRVYSVDAPDERQTFSVERYCEAHNGMTVEELHDALARETRIRAHVHRVLMESCAVSFGEVTEGALEWRWEGRGASRKLCVESCHMTDERAAALESLADELGEPGAIEATATRQA